MCVRCGQDLHTKEDCFAAAHANGAFVVSDGCGLESSDSDDDDDGPLSNKATIVHCTRCGWDSHNQDDCFTAAHANGRTLSTDSSRSDDDSASVHKWSLPTTSSTPFCARCGRNNHADSNCCAHHGEDKHKHKHKTLPSSVHVVERPVRSLA